jgi:hypothetical protein
MNGLRLYFSQFLKLIVAVVFESSVEGLVRADEELKDKKKRKVMFLLEKVEMLDELNWGMRNCAVGCHYDVNKSMIRFMTK